MSQSANYKTKQRQAILEYIASLGSEHVTVAQIASHFQAQCSPIGVTTIYRHLDKLVQAGKVKKYIIDSTTSACFQYVDQDKTCDKHFHLKCECCGKLIHLDCEFLPQLAKHIYAQHQFAVDPNKTVFYGRCSECQKQ